MTDISDRLKRTVTIGRPVRVALAVLVLGGGGLFFVLAITLIMSDRTRMPSPNGALAMAFLCILMAVTSWYVGSRLILMRGASARLLSRRGARTIGTGTAILGVVAILAGWTISRGLAIFVGLSFVVMGIVLFQYSRHEK
jgi:hypothetical protein